MHGTRACAVAWRRADEVECFATAAATDQRRQLAGAAAEAARAPLGPGPTVAAETTRSAEAAAAGAISILFATLGSRVPAGAADAAPVATRAGDRGAGAGIDRALDVDVVLDP